MFEGAGANPNPNQRMNAMAVLVVGGKIKYINRYSSSIPDWPFDASRNGYGNPMPTLKNGIHKMVTWNHNPGTRSSSAGFNVYDGGYGVDVVRFSSPTSFYQSYSDGINIHRRASDTLRDDWVSSAGCQLIGRQVSTADDYLRFVRALGFNGANTDTYTYWFEGNSRHYGKYIVDRSLGVSWLKSVGYNAAALKALG